MKKFLLASGLLFFLLIMGLGSACADGQVNNLAIEIEDATTIAITWSKADINDELLYTVTTQVEGQDRVIERGTYDTYYAITTMVPNTTYIVTVIGENGTQESMTITMPEPLDYSAYSYSLKETGIYSAPAPDYSDDDDDDDETEFTAVETLDSSTLEELLDDYDYSLIFKFRITAAGDTRSMDLLLVLTLPNGDVFTLSDILWYGQRSQTVSQDYSFDDLLLEVLDYYGEFPTGEYTVTAYFDHDFAGSATFVME